MKNKTILFGSVLVAALMLASVAVAVKPNGPSAYNGLNKGKSSVKHLYLYEKDSSWNVVPGGAWGKMRFDDDSFVFNGHGLASGTDYTLIYYPDISSQYTLTFHCTSGCSGDWTHTIIIDTASSTGFTGHGYFNADPGYTWTVTGTSKDTFTLI